MNEDPSPSLSEAPQRSRFMEAVCFWERGRLLYGSAQLIVTIILVILDWPESRILFTRNLGIFFMAVIISNVLYTSAYVLELFLQTPLLKPLRKPARCLILFVGTSLACWLAIIFLNFGLLNPHVGG